MGDDKERRPRVVERVPIRRAAVSLRVVVSKLLEERGCDMVLRLVGVVAGSAV